MSNFVYFFAGFSQLKTSFNSGNGMSGKSFKINYY